MIPPMRPSVKTLAFILTPDTDLLLVGLRLKWWLVGVIGVQVRRCWRLMFMAGEFATSKQ